MRAQSMNIQFTNESRSYQPLRKQQKQIQEERNHNLVHKKYPNYAYALTTENSQESNIGNVRFGQGLIGLKNKSANNKRIYQPSQKMISSTGFQQQDIPQLSGSFTPVLLDSNQKIIQKQYNKIEEMQLNNNILINRSKMQQSNRNSMQPGVFYSKQNQMQSPQLKKQQTYEDSYFNNEKQIAVSEQKSSSQIINDYIQGNINEHIGGENNYKKLRDVISYDQKEKKSIYVLDSSQRQKQIEKKKQLDQIPSPNLQGKEIINNQISIFSQNRINTNNYIPDINEEEEEWDQFQLRQIGQTTTQQEQITSNDKNLIRQASLDTSEGRKGGIRYNNSMVKNNALAQSNTQNYQRPTINSPPPTQKKVFLSPQRVDEKNILAKSNVPLSHQTSSSKSGAVVKRSYSAVKNPTTIKKEEANRDKKINKNDLIILKIKEQCTYKKYNDPIGIKKEKVKQKQQSELKQSRKMNYTSTGGYNTKVKEEAQIRIRSLKDSMAPDDQLSSNLDFPAAKQFEEDDDDDDSMIMSNDVSLDLDDDEDTNKQAITSPFGGLASTSDSLQNNALNKSKVNLLKSVYSGRPSTIFFPYHKSCQQPQPRDTSRNIAISEFETKKFSLKYRINGENPYKCVVKAFEEAGFEMTEENDWNCVWSLPKKDRVKNMNLFQKQNHFPGCWNLGRKDFMWRCLNRVRRKYPKELDFVPNTYLLCNQGDWDRFLARREEASKNTLWILKPADQACGRGVKVISKTTKVKRKQNRIICDYIANPHLINGLKYDLRLYVLVTSYDPLRIYLYEEGLTRFATEKYTTNTKEVSKRYVHLTNYSVNKHAKKFVKNTNHDADGEGSKWSLTALKSKFKSMGIDVNDLFGKIKDVIIKTCISAEPQMLDIVSKSQEHRTNCFELYGFDILIDSSLKPWILEVNVCPSLSSSSPLDRKIKHSLLVDVLNIIGINPYDKKQYSEDKKNNLFTRAFNSSASNMLDPNDDKGNNPKKNFSKNINDIYDLNYDNCLEKLSPENWEVLFETDEEFYRRGHFERIYPIPNKEKLDYYSQFYEFQRFNNIMVQKWITSNQNFLERILKKRYHTVV